MTDSRNRAGRWAEAICGGIAAVLGSGGLAFALFSDSMVSVRFSVVTSGPLCAPTPCPQPSVRTIPIQSITHSSIAGSQGITGSLEVFVIGGIVVLMAIALGAILHAATMRNWWLFLVCPATGLLLLGTLLTGFSIGFALLPADVFAVGACGLGLASLGEPRKPAASDGR